MSSPTAVEPRPRLDPWAYVQIARVAFGARMTAVEAVYTELFERQRAVKSAGPMPAHT